MAERLGWRGGDELHLTRHLQSPVETNRAPVARIVAAPARVRPPHAVLVLSEYQGWYKKQFQRPGGGMVG